MNPQEQKFDHKTIGIIISIATVIILGLVVYVSEHTDGDIDTGAQVSTNQIPNTQTQTPAQTPTKTPVVTNTPPPATAPKNYVYKNGTYSANGTYNSPGGQDEIAVTVTLVNDIITDATVTSVVADRTSSRYQNRFITGYKQYVVGKNIASVNLTNVSGSSLTPIGFNNALVQIKSQAKA